MQFLCHSFIRFKSVFRSCKTSYMDIFFVMTDGSGVWVIFQMFSKLNTLKPQFIFGFGISSVLAIRCFAQIFNSVVTTVAINMVNLIHGPIPGTIKPRQSMGGVMFPVNFKVNVPFMMKIASLLSNTNFWTRRVPKEQSGIFFIPKNAKKFVVTNIFHNYDLTHFAGFAKGIL